VRWTLALVALAFAAGYAVGRGLEWHANFDAQE
jgi:hypothetical protein